MIIDLILDRKDGGKYTAKTFYNDVVQYGEIGYSITSAMDYGTDKDVKIALCNYVVENEYNTEICNWINSVHWIA